MEINRELAKELSLLAGDENMKANGREMWSEEDAVVAAQVFDRLVSVQKMDSDPTENKDV